MAGTDKLPSANPIPDKLINAKIYRAGDELLGVGEVTLPEFEYMKESMSGLGILGELETPVIGHFGNLTLSIAWNTVNAQAVVLLKTTGHQLQVYAAIQAYDAGLNSLVPRPVKLTANVLPKKAGLGKTAPGKKMDNDTEVEIVSMELWIDGEERLSIDKLNGICRIDGEDMLAEINSYLGA
ncbi:phage major tail tube protein [Megalodesulfovibrio paquesii]